MTIIEGQLEIDHDRGVIWFHAAEKEVVEKGRVPTPLRICRLGTIPKKFKQIDITHKLGHYIEV